MPKTHACILVLSAAALTLACAKKAAPVLPPTPLSTLEVRRVSANLSKPDPAASYWSEAPAGIVNLMAQPMIAPRPETTTTDSVIVQAVHDGVRVAFRLRWKDSEKSEAGRLGEFSDGLALEFPLRDGPTPPVMMGAKGMPVHIFHWRAQYQRDRERGKPTVKQIYPNQSVDMYPHEYKDAPSNPAAAEKFSPAVALGNPQAYAKTGVDEIVAEGFATSSVQQGHGSVAHGEWKQGEWTLVIVRPLAIEGGSTLTSKAPGNIAFAVWQGGKGEVGSRKSLTMQWYPLKVL
ncbi:MAG: ethylbenzene dehydrogenase-related protein [Myxococcota bacterium]